MQLRTAAAYATINWPQWFFSSASWYTLVILPDLRSNSTSTVDQSASHSLQERIMRKRVEGREERETTTQKIKNWKLSHGSPVTIFSSHVYADSSMTTTRRQRKGQYQDSNGSEAGEWHTGSDRPRQSAVWRCSRTSRSTQSSGRLD